MSYFIVRDVYQVSFNYIDDNFEFINLLLNFLNDFPKFSGFVPNAQQLFLLNNNTILLDDDIDPDVIRTTR